MIEIESVLAGSTAARYGIRPGDRLVSINGQQVRDGIDYRFLAAEERLTLIIAGKQGTPRRVRIVKDPDDMLGVSLPPLVIRRCRNNCIFCFVDQMPPGCRKSLYVKDEDFRASFQFGNYITLGNLRDEDWERIFRQRLSPLYISVHATEPELRRTILKNRHAPDILPGLQRLADGGIRMHTQIVLCPGINDGRHLVRTIEDLASFFPAVRSIAVVPVGLTAHRKGLYPLRLFRTSEARSVVATVESMGSRYRRKFGSRLAYPSDELYIKARMPFPSSRFYEEFPQIENGVGMVADFLQNARRTRIPARLHPVRATVITGKSFEPILSGEVRRLRDVPGVSIRILPVRNDFFGPTVTVAGLLAGRDILRAIRGKRLGDVLMLPANALRDEGGLFIDDCSLHDIERAAGIPVRPVRSLQDVVQAVRTMGQRREQ